MKLRYAGVLLTVMCLAMGCGKDDIFNTLTGAQSGWTADAVKRFIGCEPVESKGCKCVVEKITKKYSPEQVKEKSPLVAADMLLMAKSCDASAVAMEKPSPVSSSIEKP